MAKKTTTTGRETSPKEVKKVAPKTKIPRPSRAKPKRAVKKKPPVKRDYPEPKLPKYVKTEQTGLQTPNKVQYKERDRINRSVYMQKVRAMEKDIAPIVFDTIDWDRRLRAKEDLEYFCKTYMKSVFKLNWSADHLKCVEKARRVVREGGMFCIAMPRGGGKTAICRGSLLWATAYAWRRFMMFVGSTDPKAVQSLEFVKMHWYKNPLLQQDFPEVGYAIERLDNSYHKARGQTYNGELTYIQWGSDEVRFPCLVLPKEVAEWYGEHDPDSILHYPELPSPYEGEDGLYTPNQAGIILSTAGITGSIRGDALVHPITLEQPRPDLVLLDDVQKDQSADSPVMCQKLVNLIDGAVSGLAGPGEHINVLMPCTVIREGDAADTFLNPLLKPEYQGERCSMVLSWPEGITDEEITTATPAGEAWLQYIEIYKDSMRQFGDFRLATDYYAANREVMDNGFVCSWTDRYTTKGNMIELSANQHAMNLRIKLGPMFLPEYQNKGRKLVEEGTILITSDQLASKTVSHERQHCPPDVQHIGAFIDVQTEIMFYGVLAVNSDFTGAFCDYGTWPEIGYKHFTKDQTRSWSLVTTEFFKKYPQHRDKAIKDNSGHIRAPLDAKIYFALNQVVSMLRARTYIRDDEYRTALKIDKIAIDTRWGETSDTVKRFIRESKIRELIPYYGQAIPPTNRQFEEYQFRDGWLFEHQRNPNVRDPKWCIKPNPDGLFHMMADVNRLKDFLMARLASPAGSSGSVALFSASQDKHELFANHICNSEYPEPTSARGITKNCWTKREGVAFDNDFLDVAVGCCAVVSSLGASVKTSETKLRPVVRKLSKIYADKRGRR